MQHSGWRGPFWASLLGLLAKSRSGDVFVFVLSDRNADGGRISEECSVTLPAEHLSENWSKYYVTEVATDPQL